MNKYSYKGEIITASSKKEAINKILAVKQQPKMEKVVAKNREHLERLIEQTIKKYGNKCDLNFIDVSKVKDMNSMFWNSNFNGDISKWDVSNVKDMNGMFSDSKFNGDISNWNVSNVKDMCYMFWKSKFNGDISKWDVGNVKDMSEMFQNSEFSGDISNWNVSNVKYMSDMFEDSKFNGDISKWIPMMKKNGIDFKDLGFYIKKDTWNDLEV